MSSSCDSIRSIPVNIITGFLGVGKTTAITHLLKSKPKNERWAVLVNEFGEIGIDAAIFNATLSNDASGKSSELIKEIPGGCMCCVNGLPTKVGLNALLSQKPDRLLIEPTGLGHPNEVIQLLTGDDYKEVVDLQSTITLIDPSKIRESKYQEHDIYRTQLRVADYLVATKGDLFDGPYQDDFDLWISELKAEKRVKPNGQSKWVVRGQLDLEWLKKVETHSHACHDHDHDHDHDHHDHSHGSSEPLAVPEDKLCIRKENTGEGHHSCGWVFRSELLFDAMKLQAVFFSLAVDRIKGVFKIGEEKSLLLNAEQGMVTLKESGACEDSRIEIIHSDSETLPEWDSLESQLILAIESAVE